MTESAKLPYKQDDYGIHVASRVVWLKDCLTSPRPIALIYHAGGLVSGSADIVPKVQIEYLCSKGFVVVAPNYRLVPQVTGKDAFKDCEDAMDWSMTVLPGIMQSQYQVQLDTERVVAMGHSSGGTIALHLASCGRPLKAVTSLYPFLFVADRTTNGHRPSTGPLSDTASDYIPSEEDWAIIKPVGIQLSEVPLPFEDTPRNRWIAQSFKTGQWMANIQPDGNFAAIDPMTRIDKHWPPVMLIHGSEDNVAGRSVELMQRAKGAMCDAGVEQVHLEILEGEGHLFDHAPSVGTSDQGIKWHAVVKGLDWLVSHV